VRDLTPSTVDLLKGFLEEKKPKRGPRSNHRKIVRLNENAEADLKREEDYQAKKRASGGSRKENRGC